jgi:hypothetical protein
VVGFVANKYRDTTGRDARTEISLGKGWNRAAVHLSTGSLFADSC